MSWSEERWLLVGLGANLGATREALSAAVRGLAETPGLRWSGKSSLYRTAPIGGPQQPDFTNACALFATALDAEVVLDRLLDLELAAGRVRNGRNAPRTLDLDLLLLGDLVIATDRLSVPHPRLLERVFALVPAVEIAPSLIHPQRHRALAELVPTEGRGGVRRVLTPGGW